MTTDDADAFRAELDGLFRFRKQQNALSFLAFFVAVAAGMTGMILSREGHNPVTGPPFLVTGIALYIFAVVCYCRYKGRSVLWTLACLIGCLGLLLLLVLKDMRAERIRDLERALRRLPADAQ